jgi:hypothetical protein
MSEKRNGNSKSGNSGAKKNNGHELRPTTVKPEVLEVEKELELGIEERDEARSLDARNEQKDLIQGMQTGTYDSTFQGIHWGPSYTVRRKRKSGHPKKNGAGKKSR